MKTNPKFDSAVNLMLEGLSDREIAKKIGISKVTAWRWRNTPEAAATLGAARNRQVERVNDRMSLLVDTALDVIEAVINDPEASPMVKVRAATVILDRAGITERAAAESLHASKQAEARHAQYLDDLEDPMSTVNLLRGVI